MSNARMTIVNCIAFGVFGAIIPLQLSDWQFWVGLGCLAAVQINCLWISR